MANVKKKSLCIIASSTGETMETSTMVTVELIWIQKWNPEDQSKPMIYTVKEFTVNLHEASMVGYRAMIDEWFIRYPESDPICPVTGVIWLDHAIVHVPGWNFIGTDYFRLAYKIK
jgi:hypothetical protein